MVSWNFGESPVPTECEISGGKIKGRNVSSIKIINTHQNHQLSVPFINEICIDCRHCLKFSRKAPRT